MIHQPASHAHPHRHLHHTHASPPSVLQTSTPTTITQNEKYGLFALAIVGVVVAIVAFALVMVIGLRDNWYNSGDSTLYIEPPPLLNVIGNYSFDTIYDDIAYDYTDITAVQIINAPTPYGVNSNPWLDTDGNFVHAHAGSFLPDTNGNGFWLFGETSRDTSYESRGINLYHTVDFYNWVFQGEVVTQGEFDGIVIPEDYCNISLQTCSGPWTLDQPRVLYSTTTNVYVMWLRIDNDYQNGYTHGVIATLNATLPTGPWSLIEITRPDDVPIYEFTLFNDYSEFSGEYIATYLLYTYNDTTETAFSLLTADGTESDGVIQIVEGSYNGHAMLKQNGTYYWLQTAINGWCPSALRVLVSIDPFDSTPPWTSIGNPTFDIYTYNSQPSWIYSYTDPITLDQANLLISDQWHAASSPSACTIGPLNATLPNATYLWQYVYPQPNGTLTYSPYKPNITVITATFPLL